MCRSVNWMPGELASIAAIAAGFTGLLSLFNIGGRFFWASFSDYLGRKNTYFVFFALGFALYALIPNLGHLGNVALFVAAFCIILSMYGGGFATGSGLPGRPVRHRRWWARSTVAC